MQLPTFKCVPPGWSLNCEIKMQWTYQPLAADKPFTEEHAPNQQPEAEPEGEPEQEEEEQQEPIHRPAKRRLRKRVDSDDEEYVEDEAQENKKEAKAKKQRRLDDIEVIDLEDEQEEEEDEEEEAQPRVYQDFVCTHCEEEVKDNSEISAEARHREMCAVCNVLQTGASSSSSAAAAASATGPSADDDGPNEKQLARQNVEYQPGDIVQLEYTRPEEEMESIGYVEVVRMNPIPRQSRRGGKPVYRTMLIKWIFEYEDLLREEADSIDKEVLAEINFEDGDFAFSNYEQTVNVYNVIGAKNEIRPLVEFMWDGTHLLPLNKKLPTGQGLEESNDLPRHLAIVRQFLISHKLWDDTKYGKNWWFLINRLLSMGNVGANANARRILEDHFFDRSNNDSPIAAEKITFRSIESQREMCSACGASRFVTWKWEEKGWLLGSVCKERISVLQNLCELIRESRGIAATAGESWLRRVSASLDTIRDRAAEAIQGDHGFQH